MYMRKAGYSNKAHYSGLKAGLGMNVWSYSKLSMFYLTFCIVSFYMMLNWERLKMMKAIITERRTREQEAQQIR